MPFQNLTCCFAPVHSDAKLPRRSQSLSVAFVPSRVNRGNATYQPPLLPSEARAQPPLALFIAAAPSEMISQHSTPATRRAIMATPIWLKPFAAEWDSPSAYNLSILTQPRTSTKHISYADQPSKRRRSNRDRTRAERITYTQLSSLIPSLSSTCSLCNCQEQP